MIELKNVSKQFSTSTQKVDALKNVSLKIENREIFGVIGFSGAGKSTLVRCINLLERPTSGQVIVDSVDLTALNPRELRTKRKKIGMIFQHFNLLNSLSIRDNIAFPLKGQGLTKAEIDARVDELLSIVDLSEKGDAYPRQLSGGQKQRVGIARALANKPDILLCDEATSALDPQTTKTILTLLKQLNQSLGLTIVIITHEMAVVKDICDRVAVMEDGHIKELNYVKEIFANPSEKITKDFVQSTSNIAEVEELLLHSNAFNVTEDQTLIQLKFRGSNTKESVISTISQRFNIQASIIHANIEVIQNEIIGTMLILLSGSRQEEALDYLSSLELNVEVLKHA